MLDMKIYEQNQGRQVLTMKVNSRHFTIKVDQQGRVRPNDQNVFTNRCTTSLLFLMLTQHKFSLLPNRFTHDLAKKLTTSLLSSQKIQSLYVKWPNRLPKLAKICQQNRGYLIHDRTELKRFRYIDLRAEPSSPFRNRNRLTGLQRFTSFRNLRSKEQNGACRFTSTSIYTTPIQRLKNKLSTRVSQSTIKMDSGNALQNKGLWTETNFCDQSVASRIEYKCLWANTRSRGLCTKCMSMTEISSSSWRSKLIYATFKLTFSSRTKLARFTIGIDLHDY